MKESPAQPEGIFLQVKSSGSHELFPSTNDTKSLFKYVEPYQNNESKLHRLTDSELLGYSLE